MNIPRVLLVALLLLRLLPTSPLEFRDRMQAFGARRARRSEAPQTADASSLHHALEALERMGDSPLKQASQILQEPRFLQTVATIEARIEELGEQMPFRPEHNADATLYSLCYLMTRLVQPEAVVESGVAHGVASVAILAALAENGHGELHSIDLPPLVRNADDHVGCLVPEELRSRWTLHRGTTVRVLPKLVLQTPKIGLFIHDSLFTYKNTMRELDIAYKHLAPTAAVLVNCADLSRAFSDWVKQRTPDLALTVSAEAKRDHIGLALFGRPQGVEFKPTSRFRERISKLPKRDTSSI